MTLQTLKPIPRPKTDPFIGNLRQINPDKSVQSFTRLLAEYGPILEIDVPPLRGKGRMIFVGSQALADELSDEGRFEKRVHKVIEKSRNAAGDGLFTAYNEEPNWQKAHNILMPAFGPLAIHDMFPEMQDIAEQMLTRWERYGPDNDLDVSDQMTRLTLDTIALCAFDYRFNSFYQTEMHPFIGAMVDGLEKNGELRPLPPIKKQLHQHQLQIDIDILHSTADELIRQRKLDPKRDEKKDLLARMLAGRDPETGEGLSDENIRYQMVTFLVAGHETTSGLLSFTFHYLLKNPDILAKARAELDTVVGSRPITVTDLPKLVYLDQILRESLRLWPTAPAYARAAKARTVIGGEYEVTPDDTLMVILPALHRDLSVWGPDVEKFDPDRFSPEALKYLPENAWKPFGTGQRSCIGRPFAIQEALLVLAGVLQRFDLTASDPDYMLDVKETLTLKPSGLHMRVRRREDVQLRADGVTSEVREVVQPAQAASLTASQTPLLVLFGSESGSSEAFAKQIAGEAMQRGYAAQVQSLDERAGDLPSQGAVVVVTASYEGQPPANAREFVAWLEGLPTGALEGVQYTVFGCGNRDWQATYQAVPKRVDAGLERAGATRLNERGEADARGDFFGDFEGWLAGLWPTLDAVFGQAVPVAAPTSSKLSVTFLPAQSQDERLGTITENRELVSQTQELPLSKRHIEVALPAGMTYQAGDYLAVTVSNPPENVERVLRRFNLSGDDLVSLGGAVGSLPAGQPLSLRDLLGNHLELSQPASRQQVQTLADATRCPPEKQTLLRLVAAYDEEVLPKRLSVLDLLEKVQGCELGFAEFLEMLPPLKPRQYSISSSPLWKKDACTLTVSILNAPALSGQGQYLGVASNFLARTTPGQQLKVNVQPSRGHFQPPLDPATPIIMIGAGSGLAPFRGFIQQRAIQQAGGTQVGPALLFFGCHRPDVDLLYGDELARWQHQSVVDVRPAFSRQPEGDLKYVQHRLWADRAEVWRLLESGARIYVCGDGRAMMPAVRETLRRIYREAAGVDEAAALQWFEELERSGRYAQDVFA